MITDFGWKTPGEEMTLNAMTLNTESVTDNTEFVTATGEWH